MNLTGIRAQARVLAALMELAQLGGVLLNGARNMISNAEAWLVVSPFRVAGAVARLRWPSAKATKHVVLGMRRWKRSEYVR